MFTKNLAVLLALSGAYASPIARRDECSDKCMTEYNTCRSRPGANMSSCAASFSSCLGYLPFNDEGSLVTPTACSTTTAATPTATGDACLATCNAKYNTCRTAPQANMSFCASEYSKCIGYVPFNKEGSLVTPTACSTTAGPTATVAAVAAPAVVKAQAAQAESWTVKSLTRTCAADNNSCDYKFGIATNNGQPDAQCAFTRIVQGAATESFYTQPCASGSPYQISWGYSTQFATPFAVLTAVDTRKNAQAYFGVNNPTASTNFGDIGPQPVVFN